MKVSEIFLSIEGEGSRAGLPAVFVRFFGCNVVCSYCDSQYACKGDDYKEMSIDEILAEVAKYECNNMTITGGEPLIHPQIEEFLNRLLDEGYDVNVETNGTKLLPVRRDEFDSTSGTIFYTVDYKCPSSGVENFMNLETFNQLRDEDVLKFVVGSQEDLEKAYQIVTDIEDKGMYPQIYFSPVFNAIDPKDMVAFLLENKLYHCKCQLQLHKYIWPIDMRGV